MFAYKLVSKGRLLLNRRHWQTQTFFTTQENAPCCACVLRLLKIYITKGVLLLRYKQWHAVFRELPADLHPPRGGGDRPGLRMIRSLLPNSVEGGSAMFSANNASRAQG